MPKSFTSRLIHLHNERLTFKVFNIFDKSSLGQKALYIHISADISAQNHKYKYNQNSIQSLIISGTNEKTVSEYCQEVLGWIHVVRQISTHFPIKQPGTSEEYMHGDDSVLGYGKA
jgi:hypothetical protein